MPSAPPRDPAPRVPHVGGASQGVPSPVARLAEMSPGHRLAAYEQGQLGRDELAAWAAHYPEEIPLLNDELPWIAGNLV